MERCSFTLAENLVFKLPILENTFCKDSLLVVYRQGNKLVPSDKGVIWPAPSGGHERR